MINRMERLGELIKREISIIFQDKMDDMALDFLTITKVDITKDLGLAKVYYIPSDDEEEREKIKTNLRRSSRFIRRELAKRLSIRSIPELSFREDLSDKKKEVIDTIFERIEKERQELEGSTE